MVDLLEALARGVGRGSVYALLALGFVIIFKATRVISFAQPAFMLAGTVLVTYLVETSLGFWGALAVATLATGLLALGVERTAIRPMVGKPPFVVAIITLGIDLAVRVVASGYIGIDVRPMKDPWGLKTIDIGIAVQQRHLATFIVAAVLVTALFAFFRFSRMGLAMRAASYDQETALAQGVSVGAVFALSWALAGGLAAVAGTFAAAGESVDGLMWRIALVALPVIILGGLDSLAGAVISGLVVGVIFEVTALYQHLAPEWLGGNISVISPYVVMLLVLLVRPYGLFGTREVERV